MGSSVYEPGSTTAALGASLSSRVSISWVRGGAQVDRTNPGVDIWSLSWTAPVLPYWRQMAKSKGGGTFAFPSVISFDANGIKLFRNGSTATGITGWTYTFFHVGAFPESPIGGWASGGSQPSVAMDFHLVGKDGQQRSQSFRQTFSNTLFEQNTTQHLDFPDTDGGNTRVLTESSYQYIFNQGPWTGPWPKYQGVAIQNAGGHLSWTHTYAPNQSWSSFAGGTIAPIFSHGATKIWKITVNYIS